MCDVCGRRDYDERAVSHCSTLLARTPGSHRSAASPAAALPPPSANPAVLLRRSDLCLRKPSTSQRAIPADFYTPSYRIVGKVLVPNTGLMGLVNDQLTSFMEIVDARLARVHMPSKLVDHYEVVRIVKSQIFAIALTRREDIGPQALARGGYVRLNQYPVRIATPSMNCAGRWNKAGRFDFLDHHD